MRDFAPRHAERTHQFAVARRQGNWEIVETSELKLAKAEIKQEASKAGKAAGMLGVAGFAGYLAVVLLSFAAVFGLANVMDAGWAALIVAAVWAVVGGVLFAAGRTRLKTVDPVPHRTVGTLKEDAQWLKNPTG